MVAKTSTAVEKDTTYLARAALVARGVATIQNRARSCPRRWTTTSGAQERRILDVLCLTALNPATVNIFASIRSLAIQSALDRETVRLALLRLEEQGWIQKISRAKGQDATAWMINPNQDIHRKITQLLPQAAPPRVEENLLPYHYN